MAPLRLLPCAAPPRRVVVLGSRGCLGAALVRRLEAAGVAVRGISSSEVDLAAEGAAGRLRALLAEGDALVFNSAVTPDKGRDVGALMRNLRMGEQVIAALDGAPALSHLVYVSSDAVFAEDQPPIDEGTVPNPTTLYGVMHRARELMVAAVKAALLVVRPCAVYGPGDTHNGYGPNRFLREARASGTISLFGEGEEQRPHLHVDDFTAIVEGALLRRAEGILHAIPAPSHPFQEVARIVAVATGASVRSVPRMAAPTHKHFDDRLLREAFPGLLPRPLERGLTDFAAAP